MVAWSRMVAKDREKWVEVRAFLEAQVIRLADRHWERKGKGCPHRPLT